MTPLVILFVWPLAALCSFLTIKGLRTGSINVNGVTCARVGSPKSYWYGISSRAALAIFFILIPLITL